MDRSIVESCAAQASHIGFRHLRRFAGQFFGKGAQLTIEGLELRTTPILLDGSQKFRAFLFVQVRELDTEILQVSLRSVVAVIFSAGHHGDQLALPARKTSLSVHHRAIKAHGGI